jgi:putative methyltransferase (TIGR04325 family)
MYGFTREYNSWEEAEKDSTGWGEAWLTKKSSQPEISEMLSQLGILRVLDFGGGLGELYHQNKDLPIEIWNVVELKDCVKMGKGDDILHFHDKIDFDYNVAIFSSSIQYIEKPYDILNQLDCPHIIFHKTPFHWGQEDILTVEKQRYSSASYPCWIFSMSKFTKLPYNFYLYSKIKKESFKIRDKCVNWLGLYGIKKD